MTNEVPHIGKPDVTGNSFPMEAIDALAEGIAVFDADRRLVTCNERFAEMLEPIAEMIVPGLRWEDMLQACVASGLYADASAREAEWQANVGRPKSREIVQPHSDGRVHSVRYNPVSSGGFIVIRTDVTEANHAARMLRGSEELLRTILDTNPMPVVMARLRDGLILYRSPAALELFGKTTFAREHYLDPADRDSYVQELRRTGKVDDRRIEFVDRHGQTVPMSFSGRMTQFAGETCAVTTLIDLREQIGQGDIIRKVVENCPAPILMTEAETGVVLFRGPQIDKMFGHNPNTRSFYADPADRNDFLTALRKNGFVNDFKARFLDPDGRPFWGAVSARLIDYEGRDVIVSFSRDLTDQLEMEMDMARQRERLFQNEKLSALGGVLANVAHALNNPLSVVRGHALMLREEGAGPEVERHARKIEDAAGQCSDVVKTYLSMVRQEPAEMSPACVDDIARTAVDVLRHSGMELDLDIDLQLASGLPKVRADVNQLAQVLINLLQNSHAALSDTDGPGRVVIETGLNPRSGHVRIAVADNGPGVSRDIAGKIFEPFFSTRGIGNGKGIGLTWCHRVVQTHGGQIRLDTDYRDGTRIVVDLPPIAAAADAPAEGKPVRPVQSRILVVDDEPDVADLHGEVLERAGFRVRVAYSGAEALEVLSLGETDCIISDLNMPDTDGRKLFETVRRDYPDLLGQMGFVTGDTLGRKSQALLRDSGRPYLEKPVSPTELRDFVSEILAHGGSA